MTTQEQQIEMLTEKLSVLENESRRILTALHWATKVRLILFSLLLIFALLSAFLFLRLYNDITTRRFSEVQKLIREQPAEFSEPLTRQLVALAEQEGPYVVDVFRQQAQKDSKQYMEALTVEREKLIANLQRSFEDKLARSFVALLDEQEKLLVREFPALQDPVKAEIVHENMTEIYEKIGNRYYVSFLKEELDDMAEQLDTFPPAEPRESGVPIPEQIATEFFELVRLMLIHSENYQIPETKDGPSKVIPALRIPSAQEVDTVSGSKKSSLENQPQESEKAPAQSDQGAAELDQDPKKPGDQKEDPAESGKDPKEPGDPDKN